MIPTLFGQLAFTTPWALAALLALPALYFLLRVTPPAPRRVIFPAARFLLGLTPRETSPAHTPWWILLLRLLAITLLLIALAGPVLNPARPLSGSGPLRVIIENGWSAAPNWAAITQEAEAAIAQAKRENRMVLLVPAIPAPDQSQEAGAPLPALQVMSQLKGLKPQPWEAEYKTDHLAEFSGPTLFLSDGLRKDGLSAYLKALAQNGPVQIVAPAPRQAPALLKASETPGQDLSLTIDGLATSFPHIIQIMDESGQTLDQKSAAQEGAVTFDLPPELARKAARFKIAGQNSAGAVYLLNNQGGPKTVGIVTPEENIETQALREDGYFLTKALESQALVLTGSITQILEAGPQAIILPDIAAIPAGPLNTLNSWVNEGGILIRFAGPNMTRPLQDIPLTPVPLREDARVLNGSLSWDKPQALAPITPDSPLFGLKTSDTITVNRQILPAPQADIDAKIWARLVDGTPLVTAHPQENGLLIMVHTSAAADWSDLPLSGFYPAMLARFISFSGQTQRLNEAQFSTLQPYRVLDGFGALIQPGADVQGLDTQNLDKAVPDAAHPPGYYGRETAQYAFNLGDHVEPLMGLPETPARYYGAASERNLAPQLIMLAFALFLVDALIMLILALGFTMRRAALGLAFGYLLTGAAPAAHAQQTPDYAEGLYLAYIKTGNNALDTQTARGLDVMRQILASRTSAEPKGVAGVDPEDDELALFPLLYWALDAAQPPLSSAALEKLQFYIDHGGTILVDTRDGASGQNSQLLQSQLAGLNIQPLMPLPKDHVLTKTFYLLDTFPGRTDDGQIWIESKSTGRDGVSSVILGSNDWAGGWADIRLTRYGNQMFSQGASQAQERSLRAGINITLYALTGNYKSDQVHVPAILERLGR